MADLTLILDRANRGDESAMAELVPLVYDELRRRAALCMSNQPPGHTLQATALVHEAFAKMVGGGNGDGGAAHWQTRRHFFNAAAEVMRQILVDHARRKSARKRGGGGPDAAGKRLDLDDVDIAVEDGPDAGDWEALDAALNSLRTMDQRRHQVVMLRYFAGLNDEEIARCLGVSTATVRRDWQTARVFLRAQMGQAGQRI